MTVGHNGINASRDGKAVWEPPANNPTRIAADIRVEAVDLTEEDLDELTARIEEATAAWKGTVKVTAREYPKGTRSPTGPPGR